VRPLTKRPLARPLAERQRRPGAADDEDEETAEAKRRRGPDADDDSDAIRIAAAKREERANRAAAMPVDGLRAQDALAARERATAAARGAGGDGADKAGGQTMRFSAALEDASTVDGLREREMRKFVERELAAAESSGRAGSDAASDASASASANANASASAAIGHAGGIAMGDLFAKVKSNLHLQSAVGAASTVALAEVDAAQLEATGALLPPTQSSLRNGPMPRGAGRGFRRPQQRR